MHLSSKNVALIRKHLTQSFGIVEGTWEKHHSHLMTAVLLLLEHWNVWFLQRQSLNYLLQFENEIPAQSSKGFHQRPRPVTTVNVSDIKGEHAWHTHLPLGKQIRQETIDSLFKVEVTWSRSMQKGSIKYICVSMSSKGGMVDVGLTIYIKGPHLTAHLDEDVDHGGRGSEHHLFTKTLIEKESET